MGLLSKLTGKTTPTKKPTDDVLLVHAMLLMAGSDGAIEDSEFEMVESFMATLPEFEDKSFEELLEQANKIVRRFGNLRESVKALSELSTPAVRTKCYVVAADIAMSSGDVDDNEDQLLETMQRILNVDDDTATKVLEVLSLKYAR